MAARSPSVTIGTAHLAVPADQGMTGRRAALASLDRVHWPRSGETDDVWLFLRKLDVTAHATDLGGTAVAQASALDAAAVDGWRAGSQDLAVRFASRGALLARLARDLADGTAQEFWFWDMVLAELPDLDPPAAIATLLAREPLQILSVLQELQTQNAVGPVLRLLRPEGFVAILQAVASETGWQVMSDPSAPKVIEPNVVIPDRSIERVQHWAKVVGHTPPPPGPMARFLATVALWETAPYLLAAPGLGETALTLVRAPTGVAASEFPPDGVEDANVPDAGRDVTRTGSAVSTLETSDIQNDAEVGASNIVGKADRPDAQLQGDKGLSPNKVAVIADQNVAETGANPMRVGSSEILADAWDNPDTSVPIMTQFGGVFFLLNVLNLGSVQPIMQATPAPGWHWLWRAAQALDFAPDPALERFLAQAMDLATVADLAELPSLPGEAEITAIAARRYETFDVWNPSLLVRPAAIRATRTHLDVDMHQDSVHIAVRQSGLDMDPGWLPWLGRIVRFHFVQDPSLSVDRSTP